MSFVRRVVNEPLDDGTRVEWSEGQEIVRLVKPSAYYDPDEWVDVPVSQLGKLEDILREIRLLVEDTDNDRG